ncbi:MAG TPA: toprim domain-containing protein [Kiritimatiellia bacterium]|jgi:DNA gyrase/topoisomerase IV subunit B|nr:type IIA DNA topoisomerase subunit B [Lentisphaerota bacterium]HOU21374.1 toprim domain-containing protein [Kiritimatiellia bacterium]HPC19866.1 toprim domain-containing protein [Kiritimatiellia bacterium]
MAKPVHNYDESKIQTLSALEHIRKRTGMYIGRVGDGSQYDDGIYVLLKEVVDNAVDEFIMGYGKRIDIAIAGSKVHVRDYGRGIPLGKVVECVSRINTGAKYNDDVFQFSVGLNGVGTKAVNALSATFLVQSHREGKFAGARFARGEIVKELSGKCPGEPNGTLIEFEPDPSIFGVVAYQDDLVERRLRLYACLHAGLALVYNGKEIVSENGLTDLILEEVGDEAVYGPLHHRSPALEIAFTHTQRFNETFFSFVNGQFTSDGGTHLSAFREGFLKGVNEFAKAKFDGDDVRESMVGAIAIRLKDPVFESQTKNKLGNTEIRSDLVARIRDVVADLLHRNPAAAETLVKKIEETQNLRKELQTVKKLARERSKAVSIRVPQLKDCKSHLDPRRRRGLDSMIFITEGQSAAGSITACRNVTTQAVFTLRGKPLNVAELNRDAMYTNEELYNLMRALNIEESLDGLRFHRIIMATDADVDGLHIRNLLLTFFLRFFEPLVLAGHLHILETPLFRVRNKKETRYCYSEAERDAAIAALRGAEVTRFKGLGEISPGEFKNFIGDRMRLTPVQVTHEHHIPGLLRFYMGRNTPERRQFIMEHLRIAAEA